MPVYKKKETASRSLLNWDGYRFPRGVEVTTPHFIKPHADLELISPEPFPPSSVLLYQPIDFTEETGGEITVDIPHCDSYIIQLQVRLGILVLEENNVQGAAPMTIKENLAYISQVPVHWKNVCQLSISSTEIASGTLIIERV